MKSPIIKTTFSWLCDPDCSIMVYSSPSGLDLPKTVIPMPENIGQAWLTSIYGGLNMLLRRYTYHSGDKSSGLLHQLSHIVEEFSEPVLVVRSINSGEIIVHDLKTGLKLILRGGVCLFQLSDAIESQISIDSSEDIEAFVLIIGYSVLKQQLGSESAQMLLKQLGIENTPEMKVLTVPRHITSILHSSMPDHLSGNIGKMFAQARVLEFICAISEHIIGKHQESPILNSDALISVILNELLCLNGKLPSIDQLGVKYGMSSKEMNGAFERLYGQTLFSYVTNLRFERAHKAILDGGTPLKVIAADNGYSHVNHFIYAFRKKFGYTPGSLRKKTVQIKKAEKKK